MRRFELKQLKKRKWPSRRKPRPKAEKNASRRCGLKTGTGERPPPQSESQPDRIRDSNQHRLRTGLLRGPAVLVHRNGKLNDRVLSGHPRGGPSPCRCAQAIDMGQVLKHLAKFSPNNMPPMRNRWQLAHLPVHALRAGRSTGLCGLKNPVACCAQCDANAPKVVSTAKPKPAENSAKWASVNA